MEKQLGTLEVHRDGASTIWGKEGFFVSTKDSIEWYDSPPEFTLHRLSSVETETVNQKLITLFQSNGKLTRTSLIGLFGQFSPDPNWGRELLKENRIYRQSAARGGEPGVVDLLDELERVLLEVEHTPSRLSASELTQIQQRIDTAGILFKIQVVGSHMREQQKAGARELARRSL